MHCASRCELGAQTLDMHFPEDCQDPLIMVLCSAATACKRLQHLAIGSADRYTEYGMGAVARTCGSYCIRNSARGEGPGKGAG